MLFTMALLFVMHISTPDRFTKDHGGIAVALFIISASFTAASTSGGIFNPAVALGVCMASSKMSLYWIYVVRVPALRDFGSLRWRLCAQQLLASVLRGPWSFVALVHAHA